MIKTGWHYCGHCQGTGICKNKLKDIVPFYRVIPVPLMTSCDSCLIAVGADPTKTQLVVKCEPCEGTGYVYLGPDGNRIPPRKKSEGLRNAKE